LIYRLVDQVLEQEIDQNSLLGMCLRDRARIGEAIRRAAAVNLHGFGRIPGHFHLKPGADLPMLPLRALLSR